MKQYRNTLTNKGFGITYENETDNQYQIEGFFPFGESDLVIVKIDNHKNGKETFLCGIYTEDVPMKEKEKNVFDSWDECNECINNYLYN